MPWTPAGLRGQRPPHRVLVEERRRRILDLVRTRERLTVGELVKHFGVSPVTARGDLDALAANGEIVRSHGGAPKRKRRTEERLFPASMTYPGTCANRDRAKQLAPNLFVVVPVLREPDLGTHGV